MRILVGCEFTGNLRRTLRARGHDAWSCDLLPAEDGDRHHFQADVFDVLGMGWDAGFFFPPCTYLCNSGVRWLVNGGKCINPERWRQMVEGATFFRRLLNCGLPRVACENPVMHGYAASIVGEGAAFTVQPWQFGHGEVKRTCFWTRNLPPLKPTNIVEGREAKVLKMSPGPNRGLDRSRTYEGIAAAIADQWAIEAEVRAA